MASALNPGGGSSLGGEETDAQSLAKARKSLLSSVARLGVAQKPQSATLKSYGNVAPSYEEQQQQRKANPLESGFASILSVLNKPSQGLLRGVQAGVAGEGVGGIIKGIKRGLSTGPGDDRTNLRGAIIAPQAEVWNRLDDEQKKQLEKVAEEQGGTVFDVIDFLGVAASDPLNLVPFGGIAKGVGKAAKPLTSAVGSSRAGQKVTEAVSATGGLRRELGEDVAQAAGRAKSAAFAEKSRAADDLQVKLGALSRQIPDFERFVADTLDPALRAGERATDTLETTLRQAGENAAADYVQAMKEIAPFKQPAGPEQLSLLDDAAGQTGVQHAATDALKRWAAKRNTSVDDIVRSLPEDATAANAEIQQLTKGAVKEGVETSALQASVKNYGKRLEEQAVRKVDDSIAQLTDEAGTPLLVRGGEKPAGYVKYQDGYAHPEAAKYMSDLRSRATEPDAWSDLGRAADSGTQAWKNLTLNLPPFFAARFVRDTFSNQIQLWQKGFKNPEAYKDSFTIIRELSKGAKQGKVRAEAASSLSPQHQKWLKEMDEMGTIDSGRIRADLRHAGLEITNKQKWKRRVDPRIAESLWTMWGTKGNTFGDDISRIAGYIGFRKQGKSAEEASKLVDEALFNYSDLTKFERGARKYVPFYTFMKKNAALQAWALAHVPQKTLNIERLRDALAQEEAVDSELLPQYALAGGQIPLAKIGGVPVLGAIDTPQQAAAKQFQPLLDLASDAPGTPERFKTQAGTSGGVAGLLSNVGGLPGSLAKLGAEEATGESLFTGAPLKPGGTEKAKRLGAAFVPRATQYESTFEGLQGTPTERAAQILRLLGVSSTPVTERKQVGEAKRRAGEVRESANRQGLPSAEALGIGSKKGSRGPLKAPGKSGGRSGSGGPLKAPRRKSTR